MGEKSAWTGKLVDRYRIGTLLGRGGMGEVYAAVQEGLNRSVAVKVISEDALEKKSAQKRFEREIMACAGIPPHPNIVQVFDAGIFEGRSYYVMERLSGRSLAEVVEEGTTLSEDLLYRICEDLASALSHLHGHGILHRDIKPANVMVTDEGPIKLMDFGLAWMKDLTRLTKTGKAIGTPAYMSPEMLRGHGLCEASDLFQLGAVVYELACGRPLARGQSLEALIQSLLSGETVPPCKLNPDVGQALSDIIVRSVERDLAKRYTAASEILRDLEAGREAGKLARAEADAGRRGEESKKLRPISRSDPSLPSGDDVTEARPSRSRRGFDPRRLSPLFPVVGLVLVSGLLFSVLRLIRSHVGGARTVPIREFRALTGLRGVRLTWQTDEAVESRVGVRREEQSVERIVRGPEGTRRRHEVLVRGLESGVRYAFNVVLADGSRSLTRRIALPGNLQVEGPFPEEGAEPGPQVFRFNLPVRASVEYRCGNRVLAEPAEEGFADKLRFLPRKLDPLEEVSDLRLRLRTVDGELLMRGPYEVPSLARRLSSLLEEAPLDDLRKALWASPVDGPPWQTLREELSRRGISELLASFQGLASSYFTRDAIAMDERFTMARRLQRLQLVDLVAQGKGARPLFGIEKLLHPLVRTSPRSEGRKAWDLRLEAHRDLHVPVGLSEKEIDRLEYGTRLAYPEVDRFLRETVHRTRLDELAVSRCREVAVTVRLARVYPNIVLEVDLNGRLRGFVHRKGAGEDPFSTDGMYARVQGWMDQKYQSPSIEHELLFHPSALRVGPNELRIRFIRLGGRVPAFPSLRSVAFETR